LERESYKNESPGTILAREAGLNDEQIEAMYGIQDLMPPNIFAKLKNKPPHKITETVQRYAPVFIAETQILTEALNGGNDLLPEMNRRRIANEFAKNVRTKIIRNPSPELPLPDSSI
jgi:hypothetical protein